MTPDTGTYTIRRGDQSFGPYTAAEIAAYTATGNIVPSDAVFDHDAQQWITVQALLSRHATGPAGGATLPGGAAAGSPATADPFQGLPGAGPLSGMGDQRAGVGADATPPGAVPPNSRRGDAVTALVMGLLALACCGPLFGILAIVFGLRGMKDPANQGMAVAGLVLGLVGVVLGSLWLVVYVISHVP